jgi:hypothetical protein
MPSTFDSRRAAFASAPLLIAAATICTGCGPAANKTARLAGAITIAGQAPPADARIRLNISPTTPKQGGGAGSRVTGNQYDCTSCPLGKVTVYIAINHSTGDNPTDAARARGDESTSLIDPIYSAGIELDVTGDNLKQDFDLKPYKPSP